MKKLFLIGLLAVTGLRVAMASPQTSDAALKALQAPPITFDGSSTLDCAGGRFVFGSSFANASNLTITNAALVDCTNLTDLFYYYGGPGFWLTVSSASVKNISTLFTAYFAGVENGDVLVLSGCGITDALSLAGLGTTARSTSATIPFPKSTSARPLPTATRIT